MRIVPSLAFTALLVIASAASNVAVAQTGPLEPRMVMAGTPTPLPSPTKSENAKVPLNLQIGLDGRVTNVVILTSSGDEKFDEKVRKYYLRYRLVPALDEKGTPIPSEYQFVYKYSKYPEEDVPVNAMLKPDSQNSKTIGEPGVSRARIYDEVDRINRMRCKDFVWEYDLMKDIAGAKPIYNERMLRTSLSMFVVHKSVKGDELNTIKIAFSETVRDAVAQCRKQPDEKYFLDVLSPALESKLKR